jgi:hypothetical protein
MHKRLWIAILTAALLAVAGPAILWSKPPDLPVNTKETCKPTQEIESGYEELHLDYSFVDAAAQTPELPPMPEEATDDEEFGASVGYQSPPWGSRLTATLQIPELLPMPEEATDDDETMKGLAEQLPDHATKAP